jgi:CubicO group peptidase (beta-lactamase class C family)
VAVALTAETVLHHEVFGAYREDHVFFLASSAKPIAASAMVFLEEEGLLSLDEPAGRWFPQLDARVTLRRLLSHSAGIFGNQTEAPAQKDLLHNRGRTLAEAAEAIAAQPLDHPPGGVAYSDAGFQLAGRIAELVTGLGFDEMVRDRLTIPLGMPETYFAGPEWRRLQPAQAGVTGQPEGLPHKLIRCGSGAFSTAADLTRFLQFHLREPHAEMRRDQTGGRWTQDPMGGSNAGYGLGWQLGELDERGIARVFFHAGAFGTLLWADAEGDRGVILLTQAPILRVYAFWRELLGRIRAESH